MPRGDGTGPWGNRLLGGGRQWCRGFAWGRGGFAGSFGFTSNTIMVPEVFEEQAAYLEKQAANLRSLAKRQDKAK